jgi:hypothetical protein
MGDQLRILGLLTLIAAMAVAGCSRDDDVTASTNSCAAKLYATFDPKSFDQCFNACMRCDHGVTTTCSTACRLKGAR